MGHQPIELTFVDEVVSMSHTDIELTFVVAGAAHPSLPYPAAVDLRRRHAEVRSRRPRTQTIMLAVMAATEDDLLVALRGPQREAAIADLHALLLRAARFELGRRGMADDDLATEAADDALMAVLGKLEQFRGASRFTTWVYKFALLEAGVKARRRAWHGREIAIDEERWPEIPDAGLSAHERLEQQELLRAIQRCRPQPS